MRRLVVALLVAFLAFTLAGCGGGGGEEAAAPAEGEVAAPPAPPTASGEAVTDPVADRSAKDPEVFKPFPTGTFVPKEILGRLESKQPMLLLFIDGQQKTTDDVREEVDAVVEANRGMIDLIVYDIGKYTSISSTGEIKVDPALAESVEGRQATELATQLKVTFAPFMVIVDDQGYIIFNSRGPLDRDLIERQVQRVSE